MSAYKETDELIEMMIDGYESARLAELRRDTEAIIKALQRKRVNDRMAQENES